MYYLIYLLGHYCEDNVQLPKSQYNTTITDADCYLGTSGKISGACDLERNPKWKKVKSSCSKKESDLRCC